MAEIVNFVSFINLFGFQSRILLQLLISCTLFICNAYSTHTSNSSTKYAMTRNWSNKNPKSISARLPHTASLVGCPCMLPLSGVVLDEMLRENVSPDYIISVLNVVNC